MPVQSPGVQQKPMGQSAPMTKGLTLVAAGDAQFMALGARYYGTWTPWSLGLRATHSPQIRDGVQIAHAASIAGSHARMFNEPNCSAQANMNLDGLVAGVKALFAARPDLAWGAPEWDWSSTGYRPHDLINRYGSRPPFKMICIHCYGWNAAQVIASCEAQCAAWNTEGYTGLPIWVTEFGGWPNAQQPAAIARDCLRWFRSKQRIATAWWFPTRQWEGWPCTHLLNSDGTLTDVGKAFRGG